ncbi:YjbQ family protein [bacterium]|nr:YjbQ family protein [bacterium]
MQIKTEYIQISTKGHSDMVDVTPQVNDILSESGMKEGQVTVFATGATAAVTTVEYEPGLLRDVPEALNRIAPEGAHYHHDATWGDGNGNSHVRASLVGPSLTVPFVSGRLLLGTWQQIVFLDCDNRSRQRKIPVQLIGK